MPRFRVYLDAFGHMDVTADSPSAAEAKVASWLDQMDASEIEWDTWYPTEQEDGLTHEVE